MTPDLDKIDDAVLALLFLTSSRREGELARAWKGTIGVRWGGFLRRG